jgi:hypothetical protein
MRAIAAFEGIERLEQSARSGDMDMARKQLEVPGLDFGKAATAGIFLPPALIAIESLRTRTHPSPSAFISGSRGASVPFLGVPVDADLRRAHRHDAVGGATSPERLDRVDWRGVGASMVAHLVEVDVLEDSPALF